MIIKPSNMSRRSFLRNALGVTTAIFVPTTQLIVLRPRTLEAFILTGIPNREDVARVVYQQRHEFVDAKPQYKLKIELQGFGTLITVSEPAGPHCEYEGPMLPWFRTIRRRSEVVAVDLD